MGCYSASGEIFAICWHAWHISNLCKKHVGQSSHYCKRIAADYGIRQILCMSRLT